MFEQAFKNIDDTLWKDAGCSSELVPSFLGFGETPSVCSIVDPPEEGIHYKESPNLSLFLGHYSRVVGAIGHLNLSRFLRGDLHSYTETRKRPFVVGTADFGKSEQSYILSPLPRSLFEYRYFLEYFDEMLMEDRYFSRFYQRNAFCYGIRLDIAKLLEPAAKAHFQRPDSVPASFTNIVELLGIPELSIDDEQKIAASHDGTIVAPMRIFGRREVFEI